MNATTKPRIPLDAEREIMCALAKDLRIGTDEIERILEKRGVARDPSALQRSYRLAVGRRLMASLQDDEGKREVLAACSGEGGIEYVVVDACNDPQKLKAMRRRLARHTAGLENTSGKIKARIGFLERFIGFAPPLHKRKRGASRRKGGR